MHPPRRRQLLPPSSQEQACRADEVEAWRAERTRREAELRPARLAAVRTGPSLRDLDAAADCGCGCHPRAADVDLHDGGPSCPCQKTPEERQQAWKELFEELEAMEPDPGIESGAAELIGAIGWERYAAWVAQEHFADHSPGRRQLPTRTVMPRSAAAWASRSSKVASSAGLVSSAVSNTQQSGIRRPVRARSSASCPAASPGSS